MDARKSTKVIRFTIPAIILITACYFGYREVAYPAYVGMTLKVENDKAKEFIFRVKDAQLVYKAKNSTYGNIIQLIEAKLIDPSFGQSRYIGFQYDIKVNGDKYEASAICIHQRAPMSYLTDETGKTRRKNPKDDGSIEEVPVN